MAKAEDRKTLKIDPDLHEKLKKIADDEGLLFHRMIERILTDWIKQHEQSKAGKNQGE